MDKNLLAAPEPAPSVGGTALLEQLRAGATQSPTSTKKLSRLKLNSAEPSTARVVSSRLGSRVRVASSLRATRDARLEKAGQRTGMIGRSVADSRVLQLRIDPLRAAQIVSLAAVLNESCATAGDGKRRVRLLGGESQLNEEEPSVRIRLPRPELR